MNIWYKILDFFDWLWGLLPVNRCVMCFGWFPNKQIDHHRISSGAMVPVCKECWTKYSGEK